MIKTTLDTFPYDRATIIETSSGNTIAIDLMFVNTGTSIAYINGLPLATGSTVHFGCNEGESLDSKVNLTFSTGGTPKCYMVRRRIITK